MRLFTLVTCLLLTAALMTACSKSGPINPSVAGPDRHSLDFDPAVPIFSGIYQYTEADVAGIINGPGTINYDTPWEDFFGRSWAVAVGHEYQQSGGHRFVVRFLCSNGSMSDAFYVSLPEQEIRSVRVAACYFNQIDGFGNGPFVEVAITYQRWHSVEEYWFIQVHRLAFSPTDFNTGNFEFDWGYSYPVCHRAGMQEIQPDIAYNPETGDLFLVFSRLEAPGLTRIYYSQGIRLPNLRLVDWATWGIGRLAQYEFQPGDPPEVIDWMKHNGYHARIDIGRIAFGHYPYNVDWMIAIAYTGGKLALAWPGRWHVRINYWPVSYLPTNADFLATNMSVFDHKFGNLAGGLPMLDIGPPGTNMAAVVWTQARSSSWSNATVSYWDTHGGHNRINADSTWGTTCSASPSVVIHDYDPGEPDYLFASVSYLTSTNYMWAHWEPQIRYFESMIDPEPGTTPEEIAVLDDSFFDIEDNDPETDIHGKWDVGTAPEHFIGTSSSLTVLGNEFWMVWSGFEFGAGPTVIYGTYGEVF